MTAWLLTVDGALVELEETEEEVEEMVLETVEEEMVSFPLPYSESLRNFALLRPRLRTPIRIMSSLSFGAVAADTVEGGDVEVT